MSLGVGTPAKFKNGMVFTKVTQQNSRPPLATLKYTNPTMLPVFTIHTTLNSQYT